MSTDKGLGRRFYSSLPGSIDLNLENAVFFLRLPGTVKELWEPRIIRVKLLIEKEHECVKPSFQLQLGKVKAYERGEVVRDPLVVRYNN